jgi:PilZ domain
MSINKRRSDRIMLTVPLAVHITSEDGTKTQEEARTSVLNRHGARIRIGCHLKGGQVVRMVNMVSRSGADFRVVGPVSPFSDTGGEFGVEYLNHDENIWGIQFPPLREGETAESKALLECRKCHSVALLGVSLVEVEVLETSGILRRDCEHCGTTTSWGHAEKQIAMGGPPDEKVLAEVQAESDAMASRSERRRHRRVALQLPVRIRNYEGVIEMSRSENISKGGFCFSSEKEYEVGEGLMIICPYDKTGQNIEVHGRIVRRRPIEGSRSKVYAVTYALSSQQQR